MNTFGVGYDPSPLHKKRPYYIVEQGVRLPMMFKLAADATQMVDMLKRGPQPTRDEIVEVVRKADDARSLEASYYTP